MYQYRSTIMLLGTEATTLTLTGKSSLSGHLFRTMRQISRPPAPRQPPLKLPPEALQLILTALRLPLRQALNRRQLWRLLFRSPRHQPKHRLAQCCLWTFLLCFIQGSLLSYWFFSRFSWFISLTLLDLFFILGTLVIVFLYPMIPAMLVTLLFCTSSIFLYLSCAYFVHW